MIKQEDITKIGKFHKPHGIKGELSFSFTNDCFEEADNPFLICELDGIFVPFRLEEYRFTSDSAALVKLKTIDSDQKARLLANKEVYFPNNQLSEDEKEVYDWKYFIQFTLIDEKTGEIGQIIDVDTSTPNTLFVVERNGEELLIPAVEELITSIDDSSKKIFLELPEGILDV